MTGEPLLARDEELLLLDNQLAHSAAGRGGVVLLLGEAGIGKSSLAEATAALAVARQHRVVRGRALEFTSAPPYFPLWPCLRMLGIDPTQSFPNAFELWEQVAQGLAHSSAAGPLLWIVEDLHATDEQTLELLNFLGQPVRGLRVSLLLSARPRDARLSERASRLLSRIERDCQSLTLRPLPPAQIKQLAERVVGAGVSNATAQRLAQRTSGNPLFVIECARVLDRHAANSSDLPATVRDVIAEQLVSLPLAARGVLGVGAVLGQDFSAGLAAKLCGSLPARFIDDLSPAVRAGLVVELDPGHFAFHHALAHEAVYQGLGAAQRANWHARAERALAATQSSDPRVLFERAEHALAAATDEDDAHAVALAERAIALAEASSTFDRALLLARRAHELSVASGHVATTEQLLRLARLAHSAGLSGEMTRLCEAASATARADHDALGLARSALQLGADLRPGLIDHKLVRALEEALAALGDQDESLTCRLNARLAAALQPAADSAIPMAMARRAIDQALALGDRRLILDVSFYAGSALADYAPLPERLAGARRLLEVALSLGSYPRALTAYARLALDSLEAGDRDEYNRALDLHGALARELGHPRLVWRSLLMSSMRAVARGELDVSERLLVEVEQIAGLVDEMSLELSLVAHRFHVACILHRADLIQERLAVLISRARHAPFGATIARLYTAFSAAWLLDRSAARAALDDPAIWEDLKRETYFHRLGAEAVALAGSPDEARELLALIPDDAAPELIGGHVPLSYDGPLARVRGLLHAASGNLAQAEAELSDALARVRAHGFQPWIARLCLELSGVHKRRGHAREAQALLREAGSLAAALGLPGLSALVATGDVAFGTPAEPVRPRFALHRHGDGWLVEHGESRFHLGNSRGLELLARLLERPGEELHVLALASDEGGALADSDAGEPIDGRAARAYRARLSEINRALTAASTSQRPPLLREQALLEQQLAQGFGLRGPRKIGSVSERARVNVQRRLRDAVRRIGELDATLGAYLDRAIRTGTYCSFRP
ncbi:MAG TPA: AAA family ATPase [Polyangiaceae bacterium]